MDVNVYSYPPGDSQLIDKICHEFLSQGRFDRLRKECMANADTKPAYQNLQQRVENTVSQFLKKQTWKPDLNKNQLRDSVRKHILESGFLDAGINRIVDQVVNPHVLSTVFLPEVEEVVYSYLSIPRPADKQQKRTISSLSDLDDHPPGVFETNEIKTENEIGSRNLNSESYRDDFKDAVKTEKDDDLKNLSNISDGGFKDEKSKMNDSTESLFEKISNESLLSEEKSDIGLNESKEKSQTEEGQPDNNPTFKIEPPSDDSQESLSRMGVEKLHIIENDLTNGQDSDAMAPLEIDERTMSDSQDSDDSILKQMSPISQGRLTPDRELDLEPEPQPEPEAEPTPAPPPTRERLPILEEKNPLTFVGRIPKLKRDDDSSNSSKKEDPKLDVKCVYSSDESESSKQSTNKSDSDKKSEEKKDEKSKDKYKDEKKSSSDKSKRKDDKSSSSSSRDKRERSRDRKSRDDKSRSRKDSKDKDRKSDKSSSSDKKSSSSSHKSSSSHRSRHRDDSRSRDKSRHDRRDKDRRSDDKKKREDDKKKKSKSVDDHGKERKKREDRRSTDRDSNERERDKSSSTSKSQGESSRKREREVKTDGGSKEKEGKSESDKKEGKEVEVELKNIEEVKKEVKEEAEVQEEVKVEMGDRLMDVEEQTVLAEQEPKQELEEVKKEDEVRVGEMVAEEKIQEKEVAVKVEEQVEVEIPVVAKEEESKISHEEIPPIKTEDSQIVSFKDLLSQGAINIFNFKEPTSDFYQKFNSTDFRYFENWEISHFEEIESEFKEFINEAENNLSALSDDESDNESTFDFDEINRTIIKNSLNGIGNFKNSLLFDPKSGEFYKWANKDVFEKYQNGIPNVTEKSSPVKFDVSEIEEDDEAQSIEEKNKENHEQDTRKSFQQRKVRSDKRKKPLTETVPHPVKPETEELIDNTHSSVIKILTEYEPDEKGKVSVEAINDVVHKPEKLITKNLQEEDLVKKTEEPDKLQSAFEENGQKDFVNVPDVKEESVVLDDVEKRMEEMMGESLVHDTSDITIPETPSSLPEDDKTDSVNKEIPKMDMDAKIRLFQFQSRRRSKTSNDNQKGCILARLSSTKSEEGSDTAEDHGEESSFNKTENSDLDESGVVVKEEENEKTDEVVFSQPKKGCLGKRKMSQDNAESKASKIVKEAEETKCNTRRKSVEAGNQKKPSIRVGLPKPKPKGRLSADGNVNDAVVNKFNLPLSPESDDAILNDKNPAVVAPSPGLNKRKRAPFTAQNAGAIPIKKALGTGKKRTMQQKYDSQDLYKPRPILTGSRTRNRNSGVTDSPSAAANGDQKQL